MSSGPGLVGSGGEPQPGDHELVVRLLGREPKGRYAVGLRRHDGSPVILVNDPLLPSGEPMPTRYWLIDPELMKAIGRLESVGGVNQAEADVDPDALEAAHRRYRDERDVLIDPGHRGPRPSGGVGGTRIGVKCLHAHYANLLMGADDPVGRWVENRLRAEGRAFDPARPGVVSAVVGTTEPDHDPPSTSDAGGPSGPGITEEDAP